MRVIGLNCSNCGAVLEVPRKATFVTCGFCDARLKIERTENTFYAQTLEALENRTQQIADDVEHLKREAELDRLDREWEKSREKYMVRGKDGHYSVPTTAGSIVFGVIFAGFGLFWSIMAYSIGGGAFALFGLLFVGIGIAMAISNVGKAGEYAQAHKRYLRERRRILRGLDGGE